MMDQMITSQARSVGRIKHEFSQNTIKNEPMLFNNDLIHAWEQGGPITRAFIDKLHACGDWTDVPLVIDSRVHMLMPGWYPCIPGWHHDDVPRTRSDGQPQYEGPTDRSQHILMLVGDICPTEFAEGHAVFKMPELGRTIYEDWHPEVERQIGLGTLKRWSAPFNELIHFNDRTWHRGVASQANGWRFFIRASRYFDAKGYPIARRNPRTNEIRRQCQVYMSAENAGW